MEEQSAETIREEKSQWREKRSRLAGQSDLENLSNLNNISMMTFEGSLYSGGRLGLFDHLREKRHFEVNSNFYRTTDARPQSEW